MSQNVTSESSAVIRAPPELPPSCFFCGSAAPFLSRYLEAHSGDTFRAPPVKNASKRSQVWLGSIFARAKQRQMLP